MPNLNTAKLRKIHLVQLVKIISFYVIILKNQYKIISKFVINLYRGECLLWSDFIMLGLI